MSEPSGRAAGDGHWFEAFADHLGEAYLRYSFTKGTEQEVSALVDLLRLEPGERVLDVGCGPGRHALALARRGLRVVGVDISSTFVELARTAAAAEGLDHASFVVGDARRLCFDGEFDAVISLCQGAFGLSGGPGSSVVPGPRELDEPVLQGIADALRPGGRAAISAFSAYFQVRFLEETDAFDALLGINLERTSLRNTEGIELPSDLWTTCFTPRELRLLARVVGLEPTAIHGVSPGAYRPDPPSLDVHEFLLLARKPGEPQTGIETDCDETIGRD
jgi:SAM-dependent methyltransferase